MTGSAFAEATDATSKPVIRFSDRVNRYVFRPAGHRGEPSEHQLKLARYPHLLAAYITEVSARNGLILARCCARRRVNRAIFDVL